MTKKVYVGVDPGQNGSIVCLDGKSINYISLATPLPTLWEWVGQLGQADCIAVLEEQQPRPTHWFNPKTKKKESSILRSTCILYGNYCMVRALLTAAGAAVNEVLPKDWQRTMNIRREKGEKNTDWKNRLKAKAQQLFPKQKITLMISDALVLAEYARRIDLGAET